jgi:hypothetical protein
MARSKQASKRKSRRRTLPVVGAAGVSLAFAGGASAATAPTGHAPLTDTTPRPIITLGEEEISDVNLGTFYVFDTENVGFGEPVQFAQRRGCGGCGCRGCAVRSFRGCGGCGGCAGCRGCVVRSWGCGCGGCGCGCATGCRIWVGWAWVWIC